MFIIGLIACGGPVAFQDDIDDAWLDLDLYQRESTDLNTPYVQSASFGVGIVPRRSTRSIQGWTFTSSDDSVLTLDDFVLRDGGIFAQATALADGDVELQAFDESGELRASEIVEVRAPTLIEVEHVAPLLLEDHTLFQDESPRVLVDGTATMLVRYFDGDRLLHGQATDLELDIHLALRLDTLQRDFEEDVDFLQISPEAPGDFEFGVRLGDVETRVGVEAVALGDLVALGVERTDENDDGGNEVVVVLGQDAEQRPILGVEPTWTLNGEEQPEAGDALFYQQDPDATSTAVASFEGHSVSFEFRSTDAQVGSTNSPGCSATGLGASALLAMAGLLVARRRS